MDSSPFQGMTSLSVLDAIMQLLDPTKEEVRISWQKECLRDAPDLGLQALMFDHSKIIEQRVFLAIF